MKRKSGLQLGHWDGSGQHQGTGSPASHSPLMLAPASGLPKPRGPHTF